MDAQGDFDRDGDVDLGDEAIWNQFNGSTCTSRYEGDANGDGITKATDHVIWQIEYDFLNGGGAQSQGYVGGAGWLDEAVLFWNQFFGLGYPTPFLQ